MTAIADSMRTQSTRISNGSGLRVLFVSHAYVVGVNQGKLNAIAETGKADVGLLAPSKEWKLNKIQKSL